MQPFPTSSPPNFGEPPTSKHHDTRRRRPKRPRHPPQSEPTQVDRGGVVPSRTVDNYSSSTPPAQGDTLSTASSHQQPFETPANSSSHYPPSTQDVGAPMQPTPHHPGQFAQPDPGPSTASTMLATDPALYMSPEQILYLEILDFCQRRGMAVPQLWHFISSMPEMWPPGSY